MLIQNVTFPTTFCLTQDSKFSLTLSNNPKLEVLTELPMMFSRTQNAI